MMKVSSILLSLCGALATGHASAATYDFDFSGTVTGEAVTDDSGGMPDFAAVLGRSFSSTFTFDDTSGMLVGSGSLTLDLSGHPGQLIGSAETSGETSGTYTTDLDPSLTKRADGSYAGSVTGILGPTLAFTYDPATSQASLSADFALVSVTRADDGGSLDLTLTATRASSSVSAVPLPSSMPLFGGALLALAAASYGSRRRTWGAS